MPKKKKLHLRDNHTWKAPKGYKIVVLEAGAARFNIPQDWVIAKTQPLEIHDAEPPNDEVRLSVSLWQFPPGVDWSELPIKGLLLQAAQGSSLNVLETTPLVEKQQGEISIVWMAHKFLDPEEKREAYSRFALARGFGVHILLTMDFWLEDQERIEPVWAEVLRSLQLGRRIDDPLTGETLH